MPPRFPKNPLQGREHVFEDASGNNPFGEENNDVEVSDNEFVAPVAAEAEAYEPQYVTTYADRRYTILWLGVTSIAVSLALIWLSLYWLVFALMLLFNLALTMMTWATGYADITAMRAGAMEPGGLRLTRIGTWLGGLATLISVGFLVKATIDTLTTLAEQ